MKKTLILSTLALSLLFGLSVYAQSGSLEDRLKGRILLQVEDHGEAWFVEPTKKERVFLGRPADAFRVMREFGLGITNDDLAKIAKENEPAKNNALSRKLAGKILLQVQSKGEAWFVDPVTLKRHFLGRPDDAFSVMRSLGLGVKTSDLNRIKVMASRGNLEDRRQIKVALFAQSNSGQNGVAELKDFGAKTKVEIELTNAPVGVAQPAHIHTGTCAVMGGIKFPLNNAVNGKSETMINVTLDQLVAERPLLINVHKSAAEIATSVACGEISANIQGGDNQRREDRQDKTLEVRAEKVGSATEVTVKTEFLTNSADSAAIVSEILAKLKTTREGIANRIRFEAEDNDLSSRIKAEVREKDDMNEAKAESKFVVNSIDNAVVIDETFKHVSNLAASQFLAVIERK